MTVHPVQDRQDRTRQHSVERDHLSREEGRSAVISCLVLSDPTSHPTPRITQLTSCPRRCPTVTRARLTRSSRHMLNGGRWPDRTWTEGQDRTGQDRTGRNNCFSQMHPPRMHARRVHCWAARECCTVAPLHRGTYSTVLHRSHRTVLGRGRDTGMDGGGNNFLVFSCP
jgi:hypothetical protein